MGASISASSACHHNQCPPYARCVAYGNGTVTCLCPSSCGLQSAPVCGTDHKEYVNICALRSTACRSKIDIQVLFNGTCGEAPPVSFSLSLLSPGAFPCCWSVCDVTVDILVFDVMAAMLVLTSRRPYWF